MQHLLTTAYQFITDTNLWVTIGVVSVKIIAIYIVARVIVSVTRKAVEKVFQERMTGPVSLTEKRSKTLTSLVNNIIKNVVYFIAILLILGELNFQLAPLLAGAGVLGLAIGFGAQNLVRDVITGFFIIYEDQFAVGDFIGTGKYQGTVQEIGLRITKIKEWTGQVHMLPNGSITEVTNFSKENSMMVLDIGIAYEQKISHAEQVLEEILAEIYEQEENMVAPPTIIGVQDLAASEVILRVAAECKPMTHWAIARNLRKKIKDRFDEKGIEIPYPRLVTYRREE
nr:mechanosensitive ion channel family protein [Caldalkalibacillus mannanilyticus]